MNFKRGKTPKDALGVGLRSQAPIIESLREKISNKRIILTYDSLGVTDKSPEKFIVRDSDGSQAIFDNYNEAQKYAGPRDRAIEKEEIPKILKDVQNGKIDPKLIEAFLDTGDFIMDVFSETLDKYAGKYVSYDGNFYLIPKE